LEGKTDFSLNDLYRFYFDSETIADNMLRTWQDEPGEALSVSIQLVEKAEELYCNAIVNDEDGDTVLDVDAAMKSTEYKTYICAACELAKVSLDDLGPTMRIAFFLNVYQAMYVHYFLSKTNEGQKAPEGSSYFSMLKSLISGGEKPFFYNIAGDDFTLDEIKHGILRGNKRQPGHMLRTLSKRDAKCQLVP